LRITPETVDEVATWCGYATAGVVEIDVAQEHGSDGWPVYHDLAWPTVRFAGQRGKQQAALYCAFVGDAVAVDQDQPVPTLVTAVLTQLRDQPELQPTLRRAELRAQREIRSCRCCHHGGLALNLPTPSCPGCRDADREHPEGCQVCSSPHRFTQPCPDFY
jgi:hypothetical protein